jgi:hypothetical protein
MEKLQLPNLAALIRYALEHRLCEAPLELDSGFAADFELADRAESQGNL